MFIKAFKENDDLIGMEHLDPVTFVRHQVVNDMIVSCEEEESQGVVSEDGSAIYFKKGVMPFGKKEDYYEEITETEYNATMEDDPEDETPVIPDDTNEEEVLTRAELTEKVKELETRNNFLEECLLEMSEVVYAGE